MRVTNNMIMQNAQTNIGGTKEIVNKRNTQMTTQKKISRPSEDPVTAIRSLRLGTSLSKINQYYERNIPDGESWLDVTETAMLNMKSLYTDVRTLCVNGSTDTLTQDDRNTIINQLEALQGQLYLEGNADYAGRTVFTGYRTDQNLVFTEEELKTSYNIEQNFTYANIESYRYYDGEVINPSTQTTVLATDNIQDIVESDYYRIRVAYTGIDNLNEISYSYGNVTYKFSDLNKADGDKTKVTDVNGVAQTNSKGEEILYTKVDQVQVDAAGTETAGAGSIYIFESEEDWAAYCATEREKQAAAGQECKSGKFVNEDDIVFIKDGGQMILGKNVNNSLQEKSVDSININYDKTGFSTGELRPEYYFNCTKTFDGPTDSAKQIEYKKYDEDGKAITYDINYTVANNQLLTVNTEASEIIDHGIQRDVGEMINVVQKSILAHNKVDALKSMKKEVQYSDTQYQEALDMWIAAAQKEADYADDNMQKLFSTQLGKTDDYLETLNLGITKLGCASDSLELTKTRMMDQQQTVEELQSQNDDVDLSKIILDYTSSYTAYQASLTAASKLGQMSLLNYI